LEGEELVKHLAAFEGLDIFLETCVGIAKPVTGDGFGGSAFDFEAVCGRSTADTGKASGVDSRAFTAIDPKHQIMTVEIPHLSYRILR
jgi:hypothetical protein